MKPVEWKTYRTRFLVKAKQLSSSLSFTDHLGRQHCGRKGDYLVESVDGVISIAPRQIFEDIYVAMSSGNSKVGEPTADTKTSAEESINLTGTNQPPLDRLRMETLEIERIQVPKSRITRRQADEPQTILHDEDGRARRKFPQSIRDRVPSAPLRLM